MTHNLEADLQQAVKSIVQSAKDLRSEDSQLRIEIAQTIREVSIERGVTRDLVAAVESRMDAFDLRMAAYDSKLERAVVALERLAARG